MAQIEISDLTFCHEGSYDNIFEHASLRLDTDWHTGLVGRNGRGKTTLLQLLMGRYSYQGCIRIPVACRYFPDPIADPSADTLDVLTAATGAFELWELRRECSRMQLDVHVLYRPFDTLSPGEQTKALLAALFLGEDRFVLIDEPTNHLDLSGRAVVADWLKSKSGFILVSHDRAFLDSCTDHTVSINKSDITVCAGNFSCWNSNKQLQDQFEQQQNQRLQREIRALQKAAAGQAAYAAGLESKKIGFDPTATEKSKNRRAYIGEKSRKTMKRARTMQVRINRKLEQKGKLLHNIEQSQPLKLHTLDHYADRLLECRDIALFYGEKQVCGGVTFTLRPGDRLALRGKNGSGKTSLLRLLLGQQINYTGTFHKAGGLQISYMPQDPDPLTGSLAAYIDRNGLDQTLLLAILRKLDFSRDQFEKDLSDYSAGQKKKLLLARSLCTPAHLYIWDEPLNYIDLLSRMQIEQLLLEYKPTLLVVEHDRRFCEQIATGVIQL